MDNIDYAIDAVVKHLVVEKKTTFDDIFSRSRKQAANEARQMLMAVLRNETPLSLEKIGERVQRDHSNVVHAVKSIEKICSVSRAEKALFNECCEKYRSAEIDFRLKEMKEETWKINQKQILVDDIKIELSKIEASIPQPEYFI